VNLYKTAESVAIGHPDKVCDQISDAILDACLEQDANTRAAIETMGGHGIITITGELTTNAYVDIRRIAQKVYKDCGYDAPTGVQVNVVEQSHEIKQGVDQEGAGDQGIMVGYACDQTPELMPVEVMLARQFARDMGARDGKSQVTMQGEAIRTIITSVCGNDFDIHSFGGLFDPKIQWVYNPNGEWTVGGFEADTGLTGRKLAVDNYGPNIPIGGGCFSGKDATKVDRSAAYMARKIAVDYLTARGAKEVFVHLAYAIGVAQPVMAVVSVDGKQEMVEGYDLRPRAIIDFLDLRKPQFRETAKYGHFGNGFLWDKPTV
jgi:S-adenosylmethionine synthetase